MSGREALGKWCVKHCPPFLPWNPIKSNLIYCTSDGIFLSVFILYIFFQSLAFIFHVIFHITATKTNNNLSCISLILCALKSLQNEIPLLLCSYLPRLNIPICHPSKLSNFCCQQSVYPFRPSVPEGFSLWPDPIFRSANQQHAPHLPSRNFKTCSCNFCKYFFLPSSESRLKKKKKLKLPKNVLIGLKFKYI